MKRNLSRHLSGSCRYELCNTVTDVLLQSLNLHMLPQDFCVELERDEVDRNFPGNGHLISFGLRLSPKNENKQTMGTL